MTNQRTRLSPKSKPIHIGPKSAPTVGTVWSAAAVSGEDAAAYDALSAPR